MPKLTFDCTATLLVKTIRYTVLACCRSEAKQLFIEYLASVFNYQESQVENWFKYRPDDYKIKRRWKP